MVGPLSNADELASTLLLGERATAINPLCKHHSTSLSAEYKLIKFSLLWRGPFFSLFVLFSVGQRLGRFETNFAPQVGPVQL